MAMDDESQIAEDFGMMVRMVTGASIALQRSSPADASWRPWVDQSLRIATIATVTWFVAKLVTVVERRMIDKFGGGDTGLTDAAFAEAAALVQTRIVVLGDAWELLKFFDDASYGIDEKAAAKELKPEAAAVLDAALAALEPLPEWTTAAIEQALKASLLEELELKPRKAFGPLRVAITGATVSPPLFESMEILGQASTLERLRSLRASLA